MHLPLLLTLWLLGPLAGNPDKFWLEAADKGVEGHQPAVIEVILNREHARLTDALKATHPENAALSDRGDSLGAEQKEVPVHVQEVQ